MHRSPDINHDDFEKLLLWLNEDRETAGRLYEQIRLRLIKIFLARKCHVAEELADATIDRVMKKLPGLSESYRGERGLYFYAVARNIYHEYKRRPQSVEIPPDLSVSENANGRGEEHYECLEQCLQQLPEAERDLIIGYYVLKKQKKKDGRHDLAENLGLSPPTLRMRVFRIRAKMEKCFLKCLKGGNAIGSLDFTAAKK